MKDKTEEAPKKDASAGLVTVAAIVMGGIVLLLIAFNTARVEVNFLVFKAQSIQLWWFTILVILFTLVTDRLVRFMIRLRSKKNDD
jgi:membrane protein implicated in regulation of membrane protease activity